MSLESRAARMKHEGGTESSPYSLILSALNKDSGKIWEWYKRGAAFVDPNDELAEVYELTFGDIPDLSLPSNFSFTEGFSLVRQWYVRMKAIPEGRVAQEDERIFDSEVLEPMFPLKDVTTQGIRDSLAIDQTGAAWLTERARTEFTEETLALIGAKKAISGIKNMFIALTAAA